MGQQIAFAQDKSDEDAVIEFLRERGEFLAVPRFQTGSVFEPLPAGSLEAEKQILIPKAEVDGVLATAKESREDPGSFAVDFSTAGGFFIEWNRTTWPESGLASSGRFFRERASQKNNDSVRSLTRTMTALQRFIRTTYPAHSGGKYPIYIGPSMWERVQKGEVRVLSSWGDEVKLTKNKK
jgi:hypothetical protein